MVIDRTFIIGDKYSMTYLSCRRKFPHKKLVSKKPGEILNSLKEGISKNESATLPLWNSNDGRIEISRPEELIFDYPSHIINLWSVKIIFVLARNTFSGCSPENIGSAGTARYQCSKFLEKGDPGKDFVPFPTTTDAAYAVSRKEVDAALCSKELAESKGLVTDGKDCANPYNMTTFGEFVCNLKKVGNVPLIGLKIPRLRDSGGIRDVHGEVIFDIFGEVRDFSSMPKILFAMKIREDMYGLLIEFPGFPSGIPALPDYGETPDIHVRNDAGMLEKAFSSSVCSFLVQTFRLKKWPDFVSYGNHESYFCACPKLDIFVQGYEKSIVEQATLLSIRKHLELFTSKVKFPDPARKLLGQLLSQVKSRRRLEDIVQFTPL